MMNRREILLAWVAAGSGLAFLQLPRVAYGKDYTAPVKKAAGFTAYQKDRRILIRYNNSPVLSYRAGSDAKYPYFYPLAGPKSGLS